MQLFAISCGVLPQPAVPVADALRHCASGYPSLAGSELVQGTAGAARVRYAAVSDPAPMAAPRRYRARQGGDLLLYDGLPIDRFATFPAHDARELLARWDELPDVLEGRVLGRAHRHGGRARALRIGTPPTTRAGTGRTSTSGSPGS